MAAKPHVRSSLPKWSTIGMLMLGIKLKDRTLAIQVGPLANGWTVLAVETPTSASAKGVKGVFEAHSHAVIGESFPNVAVAIAKAEAYARKWMAGRIKAGDCECKEIR